MSPVAAPASTDAPAAVGVRGSAPALAVLSLTIVAIANKGIGLAREVMVATWFGADLRMDGLVAGQTVPTVLSRVIEDVMLATVVPLFARWSADEGERSALGRFKAALWLAGLAGLAVTVLLFVAAPAVVAWVTPGLDPAAAAIAETSLRITVIGGEVLILASALTALLTCYRRFRYLALAGLAANAAALGTIAWTADWLHVQSLAVATGVFAVVLAALQAPVLLRRDARMRWAGVGRELAGLGGPLLLGVALFNGAVPLVERYLASDLPAGSISILNYAFKLDWLAYGIIATSLASVVFPSLAAATAARDDARLTFAVTSGLRYSLILIAPCTAILLALALPATRLVYQYGNFGQAETLATAAVLQVYSLGLPGATVSLVLMQLVYALRLPSIRIRAGLLLLPVATVSGAILRVPLGMRGIAFAHVCAMTVLAVYLARAVRPWLADEVYAGLSSYVVRVSAAAAAAYAGASGVLLGLGWQLDASALQTIWIVGVAAAAALVVFAGACDVLRIGEIRQGVQALLLPLPMRFRGPQ